MAQKAGTCVLFSLLLGACGVGGDDGQPVEPIDPNPLAMKCTDAFTVTGTFTPSTARPVDVEGCWGAGTWTFSVATDPSMDNILDVDKDGKPDRCGQVAGTTAATFKASYSFILTQADDGNGWISTVAMNGGGFASNCNASGDCIARLSVTEGGDRECQGQLEILSSDRLMYWNLQPQQLTGAADLNGHGEYTLYNTPQTAL